MVVAYVVPFAVHALHLVCVVYCRSLSIVAHGEGQADGVLAVGCADAPLRVGRQELYLGVRAHGVVGFAADDLYLRQLFATAHPLRVEVADAPCRAEIDSTFSVHRNGPIGKAA